MEEEMISQTRFDQLVSDDQSQMLKASYSISPAQKSAGSLCIYKSKRAFKHHGSVSGQTARDADLRLSFCFSFGSFG